MRFDTIIKNGTIVTATDTTIADVGISGGKISAIGAELSPENATSTIDASDSSSSARRNRRPHPSRHAFRRHHLCRRLPDRDIAAAFGGTTTLIDFAIQYKGQTLRHAFDTWMHKAHDKAAIDYAFHCIITDLGSAQLEEMADLSAKALPVLNCSWRIPASSCSTMPPSSERWARPRNTPG